MDITKIYLITNIDNDSNKIYIGKTKGNRYSDHKKNYGNQITYDYIDEINSLDKKDWEPLETYWIEQFKQWGFTIQNKSKKGGGGVGFHTEESKLKMRKPKIYSPSRRIRSKEHCDNLSKALKGRVGARTGIKDSEETKLKKSKALKGRKFKKHSIENNIKKQKCITQYDKNMNFIKEWSSLKEAGETLKIHRSSISANINNKVKTAGQFIWVLK